jgi:hypothetical protein
MQSKITWSIVLLYLAIAICLIGCLCSCASKYTTTRYTKDHLIVYRVVASNKSTHVIRVRYLNEFSNVLWLCDSIPKKNDTVYLPRLNNHRKMSTL